MAKKKSGKNFVMCYRCRIMVTISTYSNHDCKPKQPSESKKSMKKPNRLKTSRESRLNKPYTLADLKADNLTASRKNAVFVKK
jgi:hypothetical protein